MLRGIKKKLTKDICYFNNTENIEFSDDIIELVAEKDEKLLEMYLEGQYNKNLWEDALKKNIKELNIFPCFSGSALQDIGIKEFIELLHNLTYTSYNNEEKFSGIVYKIRHDIQGNRITHIKALSGKVKVKDELEYSEDESVEKVNQIRIYNGCKFKTLEQAEAGDVFSVIGLSKFMPGEFIGLSNEKVENEIIPTLKSKVIFDEKLNVKDVLNYFKILESEDPSLNVEWDSVLKEIHIHIIGKIQLEVLKQVLKDRFEIEIDFGKCEVLYKETITKESMGYGHFEPLRHYAEVNIKLEPGKRNSGITFENKCHVDNLAINYQKLIKSHIFEKNHKGVLTGSPITDIKITLTNGRAHIKHTEGGDFREATYRALRQGLEKAEPIVIEPYYKFKIDVPLENMGRVLSDIQKLSGDFEEPEILEDKVVIIGRGPVSTFMDYSMELISFTKGRGIIVLNYDGYDICHNEEEIIKAKNYNKDADIEYTSSSIFCSKGQGFVVSGDEAEKYMHCIEN